MQRRELAKRIVCALALAEFIPREEFTKAIDDRAKLRTLGSSRFEGMVSWVESLIGSPTTTDLAAHAQSALDSYDFGEDVRTDPGWQISDAENCWSTTVHYRNGVKKTFVVHFEPTSAEVDESYVTDHKEAS